MLFIFGILSSAISMYLLLFTVTKKKWASFVGSAVYLWAPYHFLSVYVAAAIGTVFMFALLPLVFIGLHLILDRSYKWGMVAIAIAIAGSILTHLMTLAMILPFVFVFFITQIIGEKNKTTKSGATLVGVILALLISAFYLIPLIKYLPDIMASGEGGGLSDNFKRYFPSLRQLLYSRWGYGPIISNAKDGDISLQIGVAQWLSFALGIAAMFASKLTFLKKFVVRKYIQSVLGYCVIFILSIFFMLDFSLPFWDFATKFIALDFPFRLLIVSVFSGSVVGALAIASLKNKKLALLFGGAIILISLYTNRNHRRVNMYTQYSLEDYIGAETTTNSYHEYLPMTADRELLNEDRTDEPAIKNNRLIAELEMKESETISLHQLAFPGIVTTVDGQYATYEVDERGRIAVRIPKGNSKIEIFFHKNRLITFSEFLSLCGLAIILVLLLLPKKQK